MGSCIVALWEQARSLALRADEQQIFPLSDGLARANKRLLDEVEAEIEEKELREQEAACRGLDWRGWTGIGAILLGTVSVGLNGDGGVLSLGWDW